MIIDHKHPVYVNRRRLSGENRHNGAYYYSREITELMIPLVETDRSWVTINIPHVCCDHAIVFIHNNLDAAAYDHLKEFDDLVLVCGIPETCEKVAHLGKPIYLPLSVDVASVERFKIEKSQDAAFVGRPAKRRLPGVELPAGVAFLEGMPRDYLLAAMAQYRKVYAVGRVAIEAKILGCEVLPYDPRFPDPDIWQVLDTREAAKILQKKLEDIDGRKTDAAGSDQAIREQPQEE